MTEMETVPVSTRLPVDLQARVLKAAEEDGMKLTVLWTRALEQYLQNRAIEKGTRNGQRTKHSHPADRRADKDR